MKKINLLILGIILLVPSIAMANSIKNINMDIYVDSVGTAHVTEAWDTYLDEGTEGYKPYYNLGNSEISNFKVKLNNKEYTLLDIEILTGRKNQIRVHMESINHPIAGDKKYNSKKNPIRRMCLHATYLEFTHPVTNKRIVINDNYPEIFDKLLG